MKKLLVIALSFSFAATCGLAGPPPSRAPTQSEIDKWKAESDREIEAKRESGGIPFVVNKKKESHIGAFALVMNDTGYFTGLQLAGVYNTGGDHTGRVSSGLQFALVANSWAGLERDEAKRPKLDGLQFSLLANIADDLHGAQLSFFYNSADFMGLQLAGFNVSEESTGVQLGFLANNAHIHSGVQFALFGNLADEIHGAQIAIALNQAKALDGFQLGLANFTRELDGTQIGLVNKATSGKGLQLGLINIWEGMIGIPIVNAHF